MYENKYYKWKQSTQMETNDKFRNIGYKLE